MGRLTLALLGPFQALLDGTPVRLLATSMGRALLAYLAVEAASPHPRESIAALLWPEQPDREALSHLRRTLFDLRRLLGADDPNLPFFLATRETLQLNPAADVNLDVATYAQALRATPTPDTLPLDHEALQRLERAVALYRGSFLEGVTANSVPFEEWALLRREQLHWQALGVLQLLAAAHEARGEYSQAQRYARRQLELQPWQEEAHRQLMRALALAGQRSAALAQYQSCVQRLAAELGAAPADETVTLYHAICAGTLATAEVRPRRGMVAPPATPRPVTPTTFVSREPELAKLDDFLEMALAGQGRVAFVSGLAGSGKTALLARFSQQAMTRHPELVAAAGNCNAHAGRGDPYLPFREILQLLSGEIEAHRAGGSLSPEHARRLWALLPVTAQALLAHGPDLVGTFVPGEPLLRRIQAFSPDGTAQWERLGTLALRPPRADKPPASQADLFDQATHVLQAVALQHPLLLLLDDLQWADKGSVALLFHLGRRLSDGRILVVGAYRPATVALGSPSPTPTTGGEPLERHPLGLVLHEFGRDWGDIQVDLDQADGRAFVEALLDTEPNRLDAAFRRMLYHHTGGNPLFTIELLRGLQQRGDLARDDAGHWVAAPTLHWQHLPSRVEAVIAERLDRLPPECQALLRVASVEGEQFTAEVLARATGMDLSAVIHHLSETLSKQHRLVRAVHLLRREPGGQYLSCYRFAHILFQRYIHDHLDEVAHVHLHRLVAEALEALRPEGEVRAETGVQDPTAPVRLARHWEAAGMPLQAARALHDAGREAMHLSAFHEALGMFDHGLALLADVPLSPERREIERLLQIARLGPQRTLAGGGAVELEDALARAAEAGAEDTQGRTQLLMLQTQAEFLTSRGQLEEGLAVAERMLDQATQWGEESFVALAHWWFGFICNLMGKPQESESHFDWIRAQLTSKQWADLPAAVGLDLASHTLIFSAVNQWFLGYPEKALARSTEAVTGAIGQGAIYGQAFASGIGSAVLFLLGSDAKVLQERSELCHRVSVQEGFTWWQAYAEVFLGRLAVVRGEDVAGIERMRRGLAGWQAAGMAIGTDPLVLILADTCLLAVRRAPAIAKAERAGLLATGLATIAPWLGPDVLCGQSYQADLYRLRGELLLERDGLAAAGEALACFQRAMELGAEQGALGWELRAAMSLVHLRQRQGDAYAAELAEARRCLREVYGRFTEGFAFPDLQDAATLIGNTG
jgi:DNA-binding SARP family transcriptional activator